MSKTFKNAPALRFITPEAAEPVTPVTLEPVEGTDTYQISVEVEPLPPDESDAVESIDLLETAGSVDSSVSPEPVEPSEMVEPVETELKQVPAELKTRRVQLLMRPSVYERISQLAESENRSVNDYVNSYFEREPAQNS